MNPDVVYEKERKNLRVKVNQQLCIRRIFNLSDLQQFTSNSELKKFVQEKKHESLNQEQPSVPSFSFDISAGGISIHNTTFQLNDYLILWFKEQLNDNGIDDFLHGKIVWKNNDRCGVQFVYINDKSVNAIKEFVIEEQLKGVIEKSSPCLSSTSKDIDFVSHLKNKLFKSETDNISISQELLFFKKVLSHLNTTLHDQNIDTSVSIPYIEKSLEELASTIHKYKPIDEADHTDCFEINNQPETLSQLSFLPSSARSGSDTSLDHLDEFITLHRIFEASSDSIIIVDAAGNIIRANSAFTDQIGAALDSVIDQNIQTFLENNQFSIELNNTLSQPHKYSFSDNILIKTAAGLMPVSQTVQILRKENGYISKLIFFWKNISDTLVNEKEIDFIKNKDPLTGLPNRNTLLPVAGDLIKQSKAISDKFAFILINIDSFKKINDSYGHNIGDLLLQEIAIRIQLNCKIGDFFLRFGGDEFILLVPGIQNHKASRKFIQSILARLAEPFRIDSHELFISASIGCSHYPDDSQTVDDLLQSTYLAMHTSKNRGPNAFAFYTDKIKHEMNRRFQIEKELRHALQINAFNIYYQPKVSLKSQKLIGVEALIRWTNSEGQVVPAQEFITIAEETGLIQDIGIEVIKKVCDHLQRWKSLGINHIPIAINLSAKQFADRNIHNTINEIIQSHQLPVESFHFEVTENSLVKDLQSGMRIIEKLRDKGYKIAIDDFGTGYSSLNYLKSLPFDYLKIDKDFLVGVPSCEADNAIVSTIVTLAKSMDAKVIAEGVETLEQLEFLEKIDCDEIQGYYISKPMSFKHITTLLIKSKNIFMLQ